MSADWHDYTKAEPPKRNAAIAGVIRRAFASEPTLFASPTSAAQMSYTLLLMSVCSENGFRKRVPACPPEK